MTGRIGRILPRALGRDFDESYDGSVCDLEYDAGSVRVLDMRARCETYEGPNKSIYVSLSTDLSVLMLIRDGKRKKTT